MTNACYGNIAILYPGDYEARQTATRDNNRLALIFKALLDIGLSPEPAVYHDDFCDEVREQLMKADSVLVWMNPIQDGRDRSVLDPMLREVATADIFVSTHPDVIVKIGTKEVVYQTRNLGWGADTHLYKNMEQLQRELPIRLAAGQARVLKQYRGNGGRGVWKVELAENFPADKDRENADSLPRHETIIRVRHAKRGSTEEQIPLGKFFKRCEQYFTGPGRMIDQAYQARLPEGMVRCYLVHDKVTGFGHQAVNALYPAPPGARPEETPQPGSRLYYPPTKEEFQALKRKMEQEWVPALERQLEIKTEDLPVLWDADFMLGPKNTSGEDTYVLCEINVSSVAPFPDSVAPYVAKAALARIQAARQKRVNLGLFSRN